MIQEIGSGTALTPARGTAISPGQKPTELHSGAARAGLGSTAVPVETATDGFILSEELLPRLLLDRLSKLLGELGHHGGGVAGRDVKELLAALRGAAGAGKPLAGGRDTPDHEIDRHDLRAEFKQVRKAFDASVRDLRRLFKGLGQLTPEVKEALKDVRHEVRAGLKAALRQALRGGAASVPAAAGEDGAVEALRQVSLEFNSQAQLRASQSYSLEVRTQEGDVAILTLQRSAGLQFASSLKAGQEGLERSVAIQAEFASSRSYTLAGDFDEAEAAALDNLVARVDELADRFFQGDVEAALAGASGLELDQQTLAGFSVHLSSSVEASVAATYRLVQEDFQPVALEESAAVTDLADRLRRLGEEDEVVSRFQDPARLARDLFRGRLAVDPRLESRHPGRTSAAALAERFLQLFAPGRA